MKKVLRIFAVALLIVAMLVSYTQALTFEKLDNDKIFSQETIKNESMDSWAKKEILAAQNAGIIPYMTGQPGYKDNITREQFAELVVKTVEKTTGKKISAASSDTFTDTKNPEILKAYNAKIIDGRGAGIFDPKSTATRQEIATMVSRALNYIKSETGTDLAPKAGSVDSFPDKAQIASWAKDGVGKLASNGIMAGKLNAKDGKTYATPLAKCTVQESILLLYRVYSLA